MYCIKFDIASDFTLLTSMYSSMTDVQVLCRYDIRALRVVDAVVNCRRYFPCERMVRFWRKLRKRFVEVLERPIKACTERSGVAQ